MQFLVGGDGVGFADSLTLYLLTLTWRVLYAASNFAAAAFSAGDANVDNSDNLPVAKRSNFSSVCLSGTSTSSPFLLSFPFFPKSFLHAYNQHGRPKEGVPSSTQTTHGKSPHKVQHCDTNVSPPYPPSRDSKKPLRNAHAQNTSLVRGATTLRDKRRIGSTCPAGCKGLRVRPRLLRRWGTSRGGGLVGRLLRWGG
jgi:hypothetical protein